MPMEAEDLDEMKALVNVARKRDLSFAMCMGKKPEGMVFFMHRLKDSGILARNAKKAGETAKLAWGTCSVKGKKMSLLCLEDPPANIARQAKLFLRDNDLPLKVSIVDAEGNEIQSDGDEEEEEGVGPDVGVDGDVEQAAPPAAPEEEASVDALARKWAALVGPMEKLYIAGMGTNPPNRTQLEALWAMANEKAEANDYKTALTIVAKLKPSLEALSSTTQAGADADKLKEKFETALPQISALMDKAREAEAPNMEQLSSAYDQMVDKAQELDFKAALAAAAKLIPTLQAAAVGDPSAAPWFKLQDELMPLYEAAMKKNPPDATKLQAAWGMATEKADAQDYRGAITIGERLKPLLVAAAGADGSGAKDEIPDNVVAFQKSRVLWVNTRKTMFSEMKKLEDAINAACANDADLAEVASQTRELTARLHVFDEALQDTLDEITNTPAGPDRDALKRVAQAKITEYQSALDTDFFKDVDGNNGFTNVAVTAAATKSLASIAKAIA